MKKTNLLSTHIFSAKRIKSINALLPALMLILMLAFASNGRAQTASATWALTSTNTVATVGNVTATVPTKGSSIGTVAYDATNGMYATGWTTASSYDANGYYQYTITPASGYNLSVTSISLTGYYNGTTFLYAVGYYSLNNFSTSTALGTYTSITKTTATSISYTPSITVPNGSTLTVRIYGYYGDATTYNFYNKNVVISGTTTALCTTPTLYTVTGGGCNTSSPIGLSNSQTGVYYQLYNGVTAVGSPVVGTTGAAISFGTQSTAGTYTVQTTTTGGYCSTTMTGSAVIATAVPAQPSSITGSAAPNTGTSQTYSVTNVAGTTYAWTFPSGWTQTGGGTTNSVTVTVGAGGGTISVTPANVCGSGTTPQTLAVTPGQLQNIPCTGFNADVVANGAFTSTFSTSNDVDGQSYVMVDNTFNPGSGVCNTTGVYTTSLAITNGSGLTYALQSASVSNSLRVPYNSNATLTLTTQVHASTIYFLAMGGNGTQTATVTVNYSDGTNQAFPSVAISNWCTQNTGGGYSTSLYRTLRSTTTTCSTGICEYFSEITLNGINQSKAISSINFADLTSGTVLNVFAVAGVVITQPCVTPTAAPTVLNLTPNGTSISGSFTASATADSYLIVRNTTGTAPSLPVDGTTYSSGTPLGTSTFVAYQAGTTFNDVGLSSNTPYYYYIYAANSVCSGTVPKYYTTVILTNNTTTLIPPVISGQPSTTPQALCINVAPTVLSVTASPATSYQWYSNTTNSNSGGTSLGSSNGAQTSTYTPVTSVAGTIYYYCVVTNNGATLTSNVSGSVIVSPTAVGGTATAAASTICYGVGTTITLSAYTGTIQWQQSADGNTGWANVTGGSGGTTATYTTPVPLTAKTYYMAVLTSGGCPSANSTTAAVTFTNNITATTSGSSSGTGTVSLAATASSGTITWYSAASGGTSIGTGSPFTTPSISSTTTYYVDAETGSGSTFSGARSANAATSNTSLSNYGLVFTATTAFTLNSVNVYGASATGGTMTIQLQNSSGTVLYTSSTFTVPIGSSTTPTLYTAALGGWSVAVGTGYRLIITSMSGNLVRESSSISYPYTLGSVGSVTSGWTGSATTATSYYWFYNWSITTGTPLCASPRTPVTATVTTPCTTPSAPPTVLNLTPGSTTVNCSFTASSTADHYLIVRNTTGTAPSLLVDGTTYSSGTPLGTSTFVAYQTGTTFTDGGLSSNQQYYYYIYAANSTCTGTPPMYNATALSNNTTTLSPLNGTYTINGSLPTASGNYKTFGAADTALINQGVSGPVIFNVATGTYPEHIDLVPVTGASQTNTITFQGASGDSTQSILTYANSTSSANYVIRFNGAQYITIKSLTISATNATYANAVVFTNSTNNVNVLNCIINGKNAGTDATPFPLAAIVTITAYSYTNVTIDHNVINNGSYSLYFYPSTASTNNTGITITSNTFNGGTSGVTKCVQLGNLAAFNFGYNTITVPSGSTATCFWIDYMSGLWKIHDNTIKNLGTGIAFSGYYSCAGVGTGNEALVYNNYFYSAGSTNWGTDLCGQSYVKYVFNTFASSAGSAYGTFHFGSYYGTWSNDIFNDNIVYNTGSGSAVNIAGTNGSYTAPVNLTMDYNDLYSTYATLLSYTPTTTASTYATIALWKSSGYGYDAHSISANPNFTATGDPHITNTALNVGTPVSNVTLDIYGQTRSLTTPTIGADEFLNPVITTSGNAVAVCLSSSPQTTTLAYTATVNNPISYSIAWNAAAHTAGLSDQSSTPFTFLSGGGNMTGINIPASLPAATYNGILTTSNAAGFSSTHAISVVVNALPTVTFTAQPGTNACISTNATYTTQTGMTNYVWGFSGVLGTDYNIMSGGTNTSNTVTLQYLTNISNTVTVNYTNSNGCTAATPTSSTASNVLSPTSFDFTGGTITPAANPVCVNTTLSYSSPSTSIYWETALNGTATSAPTTASYPVTTSGIYYAREFDGTCWSTNTIASDPITINQLPLIGAISGGSSGVCLNGTTPAFTDATAGGIWSITPGTGTATIIQDGIVTGNTLGTVTVIYTYNDGNCSNTVSTPLTVNAPPAGGTATATASGFCGGTGTTITLSGATGSIQWQQSIDNLNWVNVVGGSGATTATYTTPALNTTTYFMAISTSVGCLPVYSTVATVTINPIPSPVTVASPGTYCSYTTLQANGGTGGTIYWESTLATGTLTTTPSNTQIITLSGTYYFRAQSAAGCWGTPGSAAVIINNPPAAGTATATATTLCYGSGTTITLSGYTGIIQWQQSVDGSTGWTNVIGGSGANTATYTTPIPLTATTYYMAVVSSSGCTSANSNTTEVTFTNNITSASSTTRCGTGVDTLKASASSGTIKWYADSLTTTSLGTGSAFITPIISSSTKYFVDAETGNYTSFNVGLASDLASNLSSLGAYGMYFATTSAATINSVDIYPSTAGTLTISLKNASGTVVDTRAFTIASGDISTTVKKTLTLGFSVPASSTGWQLYYDIAINRGSVGTYTYPSTSNGFSITGNTLDGNNITSGSRYYFYNWSVTTGTSCASPRTPVIATVTPAPTLTITGNQNICQNAITPMSVTSTLTNFDAYVWSPTTNLYTDSAATIAYSGTSATTVYVKSATAGTTIYTCNASNAALCSNVATSSVTVNPIPTSVTANASSSTICQGSSVNLTSSANSNVNNLINFTEGFESGLPTAWTFINAGSGRAWATSTTYPHTGTNSLYYNYISGYAANAWGITSGLSLTAGSQYTITFWYRVYSATYPEKLKITVGTAATVAGQTSTLWNCNGGSSLTNTTYAQGTATFTPTTSGIYYFGFNCYSDATMWNLYVDDISITGGTSIPPTYSWTSNPEGFTSTTQNPTGVIPSVNTQYTVTAQNTYGCTASNNTTVTVNNSVGGTATATTPILCYGSNTTIALTAYNGTIQWQQSQDGSTAWANVTGGSGETTATYTTPNLTTTTYYKAVVTSGTCTPAYSSIATVTYATPTAQPTDILLAPGTTTINGSFTPSISADHYLIIKSTLNTLNATPLNGTTYNANDPFGGGTVLAYQTGATISDAGLLWNTPYYYYVFAANSALCSGSPVYLTTLPLTGNATTLPPPVSNKTLKVTAMLQEYFNSTTGLMNQTLGINWDTGDLFKNFSGTTVDTVMVLIRKTNITADVVSSFSIDTVFYGVNLNNNGLITISLSAAITGYHYIEIKHRNSIETWSDSVDFSTDTVKYDFYNYVSQFALDNGMLQDGMHAWIWGGDVNQNGNLESEDATIIYVAANSEDPTVNNGYVICDIDGNGNLDSQDYGLAYNNANIGANIINPFSYLKKK